MNLYIHTCSPNIIFNSAPLTFKSLCPDLAKENDTNNNKRSFDKVNGLGSNYNNNNNNKHQDNNKVNKSINNSNGNNNRNNANTHGNNNGNNEKNNVGNSNNVNNNNTKRPDFTGSIINRTGSKIHFPANLKKKYCANFADTAETCNRGTTCLFDHALFTSGYHEDNIALMEKYIDEHKDLAWHSKVTVPVSTRK